MSELATSDGFREQLPKNFFSNIANFILNIIVGIFLTPYFIDTLGIAAYGLIPLATSLTSFVTILTDSLNAAVSRFLTVDLHRHDYKNANKTFNTALFGLSGIIILLIPVMVIISYYTPKFFNVPTGQEFEVILLFLGVFASFLIRSWSSNFTVSLFAYNRLDLQNLLNILNIILQVSLILLLFTRFSPQLSYIGFAYFISSIFFLFGAILLSKRINPYLHVGFQDFDRSKLKEITNMAGWVIVASIGALLFYNIALIVVNKIFGDTAGGEYAIALQWSTLIMAIGFTFSGLLTPVLLTYYARDQTESLIRVTKSAVKLMGLVLALPIGFLCGFAPEILTVWIGKDYSFLAPLMVVMIAPIVINMGVQPLFTINIAYNRVKVPGIVTILMGFGNLLLAIILSLYTGWGYYGVAIAGAIVVTLKHAVFTPWYATRVLEVPVHTFTRSMLPGIIALIIIAGSAFTISMVFQVVSFFSLMLAGGVFAIFYLSILWFFAINEFERSLFLSYLPARIRKYSK